MNEDGDRSADRKMLRSMQALRGGASRLLAPSARRALASAAVHNTGAVGGILASAAAAQPLKDAVKFYGATADTTSIWSYRDLERHVSALTSGLQELGYGPGDKIVAWLPGGSAEYAATVLAAANAGVTLVSVAAPADPLAANVSGVADAVRAHRPKMLLFAHEFRVDAAPDTGVVAQTHSVLDALAPGAGVADARGRNGFSPLSGEPFVHDALPGVMHVVHTGEAHVRGAVTFRSLMAYNGQAVSVAPQGTPAVVKAEDGKAVSGVEAIKAAEELGGKLGLGNDHGQKTGKLVIRPSNAPSAATAMLAAVMHESLWISPGADGSKDKIDELCTVENALAME